MSGNSEVKEEATQYCKRLTPNGCMIKEQIGYKLEGSPIGGDADCATRGTAVRLATNFFKEIKLFHTFTNEERNNGFGNKASKLALGLGQTDNRYKMVTESDCMRGGTAILGQGDLEPNSGAVIFKPTAQIILPTSDINIALEQRISKIVTSVACLAQCVF